MSEERKHEMGIGGHCVCPKCGGRIEHERNLPCDQERCPQCGAKMLREGSHHHQLFLKKQEANAERRQKSSQKKLS